MIPQLLHEATKKLKITPPHQWPAEWTIEYSKSYERLPRIVLPNMRLPEVALEACLIRRRSWRRFKSEFCTLLDVAALLQAACGITVSDEHGARRAYPSAGARYPIEIYVLPNRVQGLDQKVHYYEVADHALRILPSVPYELDKLYVDRWVADTAFVIVLTMIPMRSTMKYDARGYRFAYLEAGAITQNLALVAESCGLAACQCGGGVDPALEQLLEIDGWTESVVTSVGIGHSLVAFQNVLHTEVGRSD